ncbi:MAG: hypothetical protein LBI59_02875 [Candidatus Accumulibacter sp.]|jgi:hypothetical protein|nr:hypothetical protein [Accumulibacter sp.]
MQTAIVEDWPASLPLPRIVIVDYDVEGADECDITRFSLAGETALCRSETPEVYEKSFQKALSPRALLAALGEAADHGQSRPPLESRAS